MRYIMQKYNFMFTDNTYMYVCIFYHQNIKVTFNGFFYFLDRGGVDFILAFKNNIIYNLSHFVIYFLLIIYSWGVQAVPRNSEGSQLWN